MKKVKKPKTKRKLNKKLKIIIIVSTILIISGLGLGYYGYKNSWFSDKTTEKIKKIIEKEPEKKIQIVDMENKTRPFAVMINNLSAARPYQSGLQDAFIVYEIIVESGITRMMAVFQNKDNERIGSVRSSRHYYLDYALENDAIYIHWGQSPQAQSNINNGINGTKINTISTNNSSKPFYRESIKGLNSEHTGFVSLVLAKEEANKKGYRSEMNIDYLLSYVTDELDFSKDENALKADNVVINYSSSYITSYVYDDTNKVYKRIANGNEHKDYKTGLQLTAKNIITYKVDNYTLNDGENKGRQDLRNVGSGDGYYITNGYAIPIKWSKSAREKQTIYTTMDGKILNVNDGNTFIQIQPTKQTLSITANEQES